jgi:hypothetical protein
MFTNVEESDWGGNVEEYVTGVFNEERDKIL